MRNTSIRRTARAAEAPQGAGAGMALAVSGNRSVEEENLTGKNISGAAAAVGVTGTMENSGSTETKSCKAFIIYYRKE